MRVFHSLQNHLIINWQAGLKDFLSSKEPPFSGTKSGVKQVVLLQVFCVRSEKKQKSRYKYETQRLKHKQQSIIRQKLASSLSRKDYGHFWSTMKNLNSPRFRHRVPTIDGVSGDNNYCQFNGF